MITTLFHQKTSIKLQLSLTAALEKLKALYYVSKDLSEIINLKKKTIKPINPIENIQKNRQENTNLHNEHQKCRNSILTQEYPIQEHPIQEFENSRIILGF